MGAFAGGASVELALLSAGAVEEIVLNDLDIGIYSLFWTIKHAPDALMERIRSIVPTHRLYFQAQSIVKSDYAGCTLIDAAWYVLLVNRLAYSGIYSANPLGGRKGSAQELLSRWKPDALCKRIAHIHAMSDRITVLQLDACALIEEYYWRPGTTIYIDPLYVKKGEQLYRCFYDRDAHIQLNVLLESLYHGMPGADLILWYDNDPLIRELYRLPDMEWFGRVYSV